MNIETTPPAEGFTLLGPGPGKCPTCAGEHAADQPHNQQSLFYQYRFRGDRGRWPTITEYEMESVRDEQRQFHAQDRWNSLMDEAAEEAARCESE